MFEQTRGLLFDLDGTLVDSVPDIAEAANLTLDQMRLPRAADHDLRKWVGNGSPTLLKRALTGKVDGEPDPGLLQQALDLFFDLYAENIWHHSALYPGVRETLAELVNRGFAMACVTNKPERHTALLLDAAGLSGFFCVSIGGDTLAERKPDPAPLAEAAIRLQVPLSSCTMIGDSLNDLAAAKAAGMTAICLSYGYNQGVDLSLHQPEALIDNFSDMLPLLRYPAT